jgi:dTDP-4-dehydrorhamnose reductase
LDLAQPDAARRVIERLRPRAVINCAAYTQVDRAETDEAACRAINATGVAALAEACRAVDCTLVQISTDYVFCDAPPMDRPWREDDPPAPRGVYAVTKWEGEQAAATAPRHLIVRTCGLYAAANQPQAKNFVNTMLRLGREREEVRVVNDQHCTPSYAPHVATAVLALLEAAELGRAAWGTYHVTNRGATTWHDFAAEIFRLAEISVRLAPISSEAFAAPAPRPKYSVLDVSKFHALGVFEMPTWQAALRERLSS